MKKLISIILLIQIIWLSQNEAFAERYTTPAEWNAATNWEVFEGEGHFFYTDRWALLYTGFIALVTRAWRSYTSG